MEANRIKIYLKFCSRCSRDHGDLINLLWGCPKHHLYWMGILDMINKVFQSNIPSDPKSCVLDILEDVVSGVHLRGHSQSIVSGPCTILEISCSKLQLEAKISNLHFTAATKTATLLYCVYQWSCYQWSCQQAVSASLKKELLSVALVQCEASAVKFTISTSGLGCWNWVMDYWSGGRTSQICLVLGLPDVLQAIPGMSLVHKQIR